MKIRNGFVSNSSSSSFICDVCNRVETVYDGSLEEAGFTQCTAGHTMCERHVGNYDFKEAIILNLKHNQEYYTNCINNPTYKDKTSYIKGFNRLEDLIKQVENDEIDLDSARSEVDDFAIPEKFCPICNLTHINDSLILKYILKTDGKTKDAILADIRNNHKDYKDLKSSL